MLLLTCVAGTSVGGVLIDIEDLPVNVDRLEVRHRFWSIFEDILAARHRGYRIDRAVILTIIG